MLKRHGGCNRIRQDASIRVAATEDKVDDLKDAIENKLPETTAFGELIPMRSELVLLRLQLLIATTFVLIWDLQLEVNSYACPKHLPRLFVSSL